MANRYFCRECGEIIIWGGHRWTHTEVEDDHVITLGKANIFGEPLVDHSDTGAPLKYLNNIGSVGTLDGDTDEYFTNRKWVELRVLIDQVWGLLGGKPCLII